jgi:hypothetical protein
MAFGVAFGILAFDAENTQREKCDQSLKSSQTTIGASA